MERGRAGGDYLNKLISKRTGMGRKQLNGEINSVSSIQ